MMCESEYRPCVEPERASETGRNKAECEKIGHTGRKSACVAFSFCQSIEYGFVAHFAVGWTREASENLAQTRYCDVLRILPECHC